MSPRLQHLRAHIEFSSVTKARDKGQKKNNRKADLEPQLYMFSHFKNYDGNQKSMSKA